LSASSISTEFQGAAKRGQQIAPEMAESCAQRGKQDPSTVILFMEMRTKRREWTRTIEQTKAVLHFRDLRAQNGRCL
jgi:hypothetical protein